MYDIYIIEQWYHVSAHSWLVLDSDHETEVFSRTVEDLIQRFKDETDNQGRMCKQMSFGSLWRDSQEDKEAAGNFTY